MLLAPSLAVAGAAAALLGAVPAQADSGNSSSGSGSINATIEQFGQSICPSLVKPGSSLATTLSELQGNSGLTPTVTGMIAGLAIQTQCPSVMAKLANGDLSALQLPSQEPPSAGLDLSALLKPQGH